MKKFLFGALVGIWIWFAPVQASEWIRVNQLGYLPNTPKVAVYMSDEPTTVAEYALIDAFTGEVVQRFHNPKAAGRWGNMESLYRLDFGSYTRPGTYRLQAGNALSPRFVIGNRVYDGTADFILRYMRQQRCGFNPFER